ncbi:MAG: UDP-N-acetylglucosamine 1-carboxyvinyltransferase [Peptococcaceae bacterium]|nr:UDP-N-acetylglucosamine 1-carboxyvinyltransferase [Peptococcaceae bacterium]
MQKLVITGGKPLIGKVKISGAKNAALAILCAALLAEEEVTIDNIPDINDVRVMLELINFVGADAKWLDKDTVRIKPPVAKGPTPPYRLSKKLRASNLMLGPILARFGEAEIPLPGGCNIGIRPMDLHFKGFVEMGAVVSMEKGCVRATCKKLVGTRIYLDFPSVGATENLMIAACLATGKTLLENVAKEPEIVDLANFLNCMGAKVRGAGTDVIHIEGVSRLGGCQRYSVIPDRIEAGTFMVAAAATRGDVELENVILRHLEPLRAKLQEAGAEVIEYEDNIRVIASGELKSIDIKTLPYPGFPTDMQSQMMAMLATIPGTSLITENIFENRYQVVDELKRMGAKIKVEGRIAIIQGTECLHGTQVKATDLRAGAALVVAALMAKGTTEISNTEYIYRGYHELEKKLVSLGAQIITK